MLDSNPSMAKTTTKKTWHQTPYSHAAKMVCSCISD